MHLLPLSPAWQLSPPQTPHALHFAEILLCSAHYSTPLLLCCWPLQGGRNTKGLKAGKRHQGLSKVLPALKFPASVLYSPLLKWSLLSAPCRRFLNPFYTGMSLSSLLIYRSECEFSFTGDSLFVHTETCESPHMFYLFYLCS